MSLDINQIALHQLIKRDEQNLELVLRDSLLEPTETVVEMVAELHRVYSCLLYTSPSPRDKRQSRMPSSA